MAKETNLTALNEIAEKCGGTAQASNAKAIKEIADNFSGGGGGGGALVVDTEILHDDTLKCLITAGEMLAAATAGPVIIKFSFGGGDFYFNVIQFSYNSSAPSWNFVTLNPELDGSFLQFNAVEESGYPLAPLA